MLQLSTCSFLVLMVLSAILLTEAHPVDHDRREANLNHQVKQSTTSLLDGRDYEPITQKGTPADGATQLMDILTSRRLAYNYVLCLLGKGRCGPTFSNTGNTGKFAQAIKNKYDTQTSQRH